MNRTKSPMFSDYLAYLPLTGLNMLSRLLPLLLWCELGRLFGGVFFLLAAPQMEVLS